MKKTQPPNTLNEFLKKLEEENKTVAAWAREKRFPLSSVYMVLQRKSQGRRGKSRDILIAMGLKPPAMFAATSPRAKQ